jgi:Asp-tRNA(Asn)/Glu-tRNA(Gln) amidotransferase A subunit family amidase
MACIRNQVKWMILDKFIHLGFVDCDLFQIPSQIEQTPRIEEVTRASASEVLAYLSKLTHATRAINCLGFPDISLPIGLTSKKMPTSMQLVAWPFWGSVALARGARLPVGHRLTQTIS